MRLGHQFDIVQAQSETLVVVYISGGDPVEPVKDFFLVFGSNAEAVVMDFNINPRAVRKCPDQDLGRFAGVFDSVIQQVEQYVRDVQPVGRHCFVDSLGVERQASLFFRAGRGSCGGSHHEATRGG